MLTHWPWDAQPFALPKVACGLRNSHNPPGWEAGFGFGFGFSSSVIFCSLHELCAHNLKLPVMYNFQYICITHSRALNADVFPYCRFSGWREATTRNTSESQATGIKIALFGYVFTGLRSLLACGLRNILGRLCSPPERMDDRKYVCLRRLEAYWSNGKKLTF